jgi:hypothetical protein
MPAQYALPPDTRSVGSGDPPADMNAVVDALTAAGAARNILSAAFAGGADPTGTADSHAALQAAATAGGLIIIPPGTYKNTATVTATTIPTLFYAPGGLGSVIINYAGTGDCLRYYSTAPYTSGWGGGIKGLIIDGTNASAGACGAHIGDIYQLHLDFAARKFQGTGSKGIWFDNNYYWAEGMSGRVFAQQNTANVIFDNSANTSGSATGSYARTILDIILDCKGVGDGVILQGGAVLYNHRVGIYGNMDYSSTGTKYWALQVTGSNAGGNSRMQAGVLNVGMEINGTTGIQPGTISFGTAGSNYLRGCTGIIDFGAASAFATANNWTGSFQFDGPVLGDANLMRSAGSAAAHFSAGAITNGGFLTTRFDAIITAFPSSNVTGVILGTGDPGLSGTGWADQTCTVVNSGTGSITFAATATSHVSTGASCVIPAGQAMTFIWISNNSTWYPVV